MDQDAINLAKAIRQTESGGDFNAKGKSGESGAYQWTSDTWKKQAQDILGNPNAEMSPSNQNAVAYGSIKKMKDKGLNPAEIAATWNSGSSTGWENKIGTNSKGVHYDVPKYVKSVTDAYQEIKKGGSVGADPNNPSSTAAPQENPLVSGAKAVGNFLFPIVGDVANDIKGTSTKGFGQQAADLGLSALPFVPGVGEAGLAAKLGGGALAKTAEMGAVAGGLQAASNGGGLGDIAKGAIAGGATGGILHGAGNQLVKIAGALPERIVRHVLPNLDRVKDRGEIDYALSKKLGSPSKMLTASDKSVETLGKTLGDQLQAKGVQYVQPTGPEILTQVSQEFPNAGLTPQEIADNLVKIAPLQKDLIAKLASGQDMTLTQLHSLNSALGDAVFKSVLDNPEVRAGKEIGSVVYHTISDTLKKAVPESAGTFDSLSKEYALNKALRKLTARQRVNKTFSLEDLVYAYGGFQALGPAGALMAYGTKKAVGNPGLNLKTAGLINSLKSPLVKNVGKFVLPQVSRGIVNTVQQPSGPATYHGQ